MTSAWPGLEAEEAAGAPVPAGRVPGPVSRSSALAAMFSRGSLRQPIVYVALATIPVAYFVLLWLIDGQRLGRHALVGALVAFAANAGIVSLPQVASVARLRKLDQMILASPATRPEYLAGLALSRLYYVGPPLVITLAMVVAVIRPPLWRLPLLLGCLAAIFALACAAGFLLAARWANATTMPAVANTLGLLIVLLPPVYYPLSLLPAAAQWPALLVPTAGVSDLIRVAAGITAADPVRIAAELALLLGYGLLAAAAIRRLDSARR